jgi:hypothetical protein
MSKLIETVRREAETMFLGDRSVAGIAVGETNHQPELVFLLNAESTRTIDSIRVWAKKNHVSVRFVVTRKISALSEV